MKPHKIAQEYYHRMNTIDEIGDGDVPGFYVNSDKNILIDSIVDYLTKPWPHGDMVPIPSKSYAVAIIYATLIAKHFGEDFVDTLSDPDLLYGNDKNFVPLSVDSFRVYNTVLHRVSNVLNTKLPQTQATIEYFNKEFLSFSQ